MCVLEPSETLFLTDPLLGGNGSIHLSLMIGTSVSLSDTSLMSLSRRNRAHLNKGYSITPLGHRRTPGPQ